MSQALARQRLIALREHRQWSQQHLADLLNFNDRQTLSEIERGGRAIAPDELVRVAEVFEISPEHLTDPMRLVAGEGAFSWRKSGTTDAGRLTAFEEKAGGWIAAYRHVRELQGMTTHSSLTRIAVTAKSSEEDAAAEGEALARAWDLGDVPALALRGVLESKLDTLVLQVDALPEVSGAACQLGPLNAIIINRNENVGRRSFNLGHELFHLLTWTEFPPPHVDTGKNKAERLADCFASGILMPRQAVEKALGAKPGTEAEYGAWVRDAAARLHVSGQALKRRLPELGIITKAAAARVAEADVQVDVQDETKPLLMSGSMMRTMAWAIDEGRLSVRRCARILDMTVDGMAQLFQDYEIPCAFDI